MKDKDVDEGKRLLGLLHGAHAVDTVIPALTKAAEALFEAGKAFESITHALSSIGVATARAVSDTVAMKRCLKTMADREGNMQSELAAIKAQLPKRKRRKRKK